MRSTFLLLAAAASLAGCASVSHHVGDKKALEALAGQSLTVAVQPPNDFLLSTPENNRVPLVRVATMIREGKQVLNDNGVGDPAEGIGTALARELQTAYHARFVPPTAATAPTRYRIDVKTTNWGLFFRGSDNTQFGLLYMATVQLVDAQSGSVIASGTCRPTSADAAPSASREAMLSQQAAGLKASLNALTAQCVQYIKTQALSL